MRTTRSSTSSDGSDAAQTQSRDELVYRKINQLTAVQLAVGMILTLLLAIVAILMNGRLRRTDEQIATLSVRLDNLAERVNQPAFPVVPLNAARGGMTRSEVSVPHPSLREERGTRSTAATKSVGEDSRTLQAPLLNSSKVARDIASLSGKVDTPLARRDARWRTETKRLIEDIEARYTQLSDDPLPTARLVLRAALLLEDFDAAKRWCDRVLSMDQDDVASAAKVASLGLAKGRAAAALPLAKIATSVQRADPAALMTRAGIEGKLGLRAERELTLARALKYEQTAPQAVTLLAQRLIERGEFALMESALQTAQGTVPGHPIIRRERLALALAPDNLDGGIELLDGLEDDDPRTASLLRKLAQALSQARRYEPASRVYRAMIQRDPTDAAAFDSLGMALLSMMKPTEAAASFSRATKLDPGSADAWYHLGVAQANLDDCEHALSALDTALENRPDHPDAHFARAVCLARLGSHEQAERALLAALALDDSLLEPAAEVDAFAPFLGGQDAKDGGGATDVTGR